MAEISLPPTVGVRSAHDDSTGLEAYPSRNSTAFSPEPNPPFTFPMMPPDRSAPSNDTSPFLDSATSPSTSSAIRHRPEQIDISSIPAFAFPSPAASPMMESSQSSPSRAIPIPRSGGGHRRGGSEFIGGDGTERGPGLMSSSPTKGENVLPPPSMAGRRRGHAHRRSGAVSNHDLSTILQPADPNSRRTGSAPATPCDSELHKQFIPTLDRASSQPALPHATPSVEASPKVSDASSPPVVQARPRVGFSDRLEYIPRPLSTVSSVTTSSVSTVRPNHSLNGSVSSIRSNNTPSPPSAVKSYGDDVFGGELQSSPSGSPSHSFGEPVNFRLPSRTPYRFSPPPPDSIDLTEDDFSSSSQALASEPEIRAFPSSTAPRSSPEFPADCHSSNTLESNIASTSSAPSSKTNKSRQTKGKSWAGLLRKPPGVIDSGNETGPPVVSQEIHSTPDEQEPTGLEDFSLDDVNFDEDTTLVIRSPQYDVPRSAPVNTNSTWHSDSGTEPEPGSVLDLDAAWDLAGNEIQSRMSAGGGFRMGQRRLHSSGTTGGFIGPGMHYHRRAESAPVMTPVDYHLGFPRFGSNPQMADVFEEEEEDENHRSQSRDQTPDSDPSEHESKALGLGVQVVDVDTSTSSPSPRLLKEHQPKSDALVVARPDDSVSSPVTSEMPGIGPDLDVDIVDTMDEPRFSVVTKSSDGSTITPTLSNDPLRSRPVPASLDFAPLSTEQFSGYSSLNPSPSPAKTSFDVPRLGTAHSSTTERSGWSSTRTGDNNMEVGYSTEDVPSLTSSASTMISHPVPITPIVGSRPDAERSHSLSEAVLERPPTSTSASKRRSLASLSMLKLGSSSGKSKLSIETRPGQDGSESGERTKKKRHRLSRIMKFFNKSKEDLKG